jgi:hypothetical protein
VIQSTLISLDGVVHFAIHPVLAGRGKVALRDNLRAELKAH